jgi:hypothetical protein
MAVIRHLLIAPILLVGLLCIGGLTCGCAKGLAVLVVLATLVGIVCLLGAIVSLATPAKLLTASLLWDSIRRAPRRSFLRAGMTLAIRLGYLSLALGLLPLVVPLVHNTLIGLQVRQKRTRRLGDRGVDEVVLILPRLWH